MGIFSRNKYEPEEYIEDTQSIQPTLPASAPSVDGVLPPGVTPTPAPSTNNLSSQIAPSAGVLHATTVPVKQVSDNTTSSDDKAGDFIMTAPPLHDQSSQWGNTNAPKQDEQAVTGQPYPNDNQPSFPQQQPDQNTEDSNHQEFSIEAPEQSDNSVTVNTSIQPELSQNSDAQSDTQISDSSAIDNLVALKQQALKQLSPLVQHLDQSPEEKFHTTMMLLQSTDDQSLLQTAYDAAQSISDEKTRAQALLEVVNEINYFHQKAGS